MIKLLFLPSGYGKVYRYIDHSIKEALESNTGIEVDSFSHIPTIEELQLVFHTFRPEAIFTTLGYKWPRSLWDWCKRKKLPVVVWFTEDPYFLDRSMELLPHVALAFTIDQGAYHYYKTKGFSNVHVLPLGTNPSIYKPSVREEKGRDVTFVGYPYTQRVQMIQRLAKELNVHLFIAGPWSSVKLPSNVHVQPKWSPPQKVATYYGTSKIVLNTYRTTEESTNENHVHKAHNDSINNRTFEIASCRTLQLTEKKDDLHSYFPTDSIQTFRTIDELIEKVDYYLSAHDEREERACKAYEHALSHHTYKHRMDVLKTTLINDLFPPS